MFWTAVKALVDILDPLDILVHKWFETCVSILVVRDAETYDQSPDDDFSVACVVGGNAAPKWYESAPDPAVPKAVALHCYTPIAGLIEKALHRIGTLDSSHGGAAGGPPGVG